MVLLYVALLVFLAAVQLLLRWRVSRLEKRFARVAAEADGLLHQVSLRPGNANRADPLVSARRQFDLAVMAVRRDRVEERYSAWQSFAERFARFRRGLLTFRGRFLPYAGGVLDLAFVVVLLDRFGMGLPEVRTLIGL